MLSITLIFVVGYTNCIAQSEADYCGMNTKISMTHLHVDRNGNFILREYFKIHGELWESTEIGKYVIERDTMFLASNKRTSKDSIVEYEQPVNYLGYCEGKKFYFGKGPYIPLRRCSKKQLQRLKEKLR